MTYEATEEGMLGMLRSKKPDVTVSPRITASLYIYMDKDKITRDF